MNNQIEAYLVHAGKNEWQPLEEAGIDTRGIFVKILRYDEKQQRSPSILLKFEAGARYPFHNHPAGEEIYVLNGACFVNDTLMEAGDYLYTPPGFRHSVNSEHGCELLLIIPEEVQILEGEA